MQQTLEHPVAVAQDAVGATLERQAQRPERPDLLAQLTFAHPRRMPAGADPRATALLRDGKLRAWPLPGAERRSFAKCSGVAPALKRGALVAVDEQLALGDAVSQDGCLEREVGILVVRVCSVR